MINHIKKALILCLSVLGMHGIMNAVSPLGYQRSQDLLKAVGVKKLTEVEAQEMAEGLEKKLNGIDSDVKHSKNIDGLLKQLTTVEEEAEKQGFFKHWVADPLNDGYARVMNLFGHNAHMLSQLVVSKSINNFNQAAGHLGSLQSRLIKPVGNRSVEGSRRSTFEGKSVNSIKQSLSDYKYLVKEAEECLQKAIKYITPGAIQQSTEEVVKDFANNLIDFTRVLLQVYEDVSEDLRIIASMDAKERSDFTKEYVKYVCIPVVRMVQITYDLAQLERKGGDIVTKPFSGAMSMLLTDSSFNDYSKLGDSINESAENINNIGVHKWTRTDVAKWLAAAAATGTVMYLLWKNKDMITEKIGGLELPAPIETVAAKARDVVGQAAAAVTGGVVFVGNKLADAASWGYTFIPSKKGITEGMEKAAASVAKTLGAAKAFDIADTLKGFTLFGDQEAPRVDSNEAPLVDAD